MVRDGEDFVVRDAKSDEDITRPVLTQIIFEEEAKGQNMLPTKFLRQLIRLYGDTLQGFVPGYLEASMETFSHNQEKMREQLAAAMGGNPALSNIETMARTNMDWFENAMRMFAPFGATGGNAGTEEASSAEATPDSSRAELDELKDQLTRMQAQLSKIAGGR